MDSQAPSSGSSDAPSRRLARLIGPTLVAITLPEMVQPGLYDGQKPSEVYGSGMLWFVAGAAILRDHHAWTRRWPVLITGVGWVAVLGGLARMFGATNYPSSARSGPGIVLGEAAVIALGIFLSWKGWERSPR